MFLIELFLPLYDNDGKSLPRDLFEQVRAELVERFGGLTAHSRAPARGLWKEEDGDTVRDDLLVYEVMAENLDEAWWHDYRHVLEQRFRQEAMIVRAHSVRML